MYDDLPKDLYQYIDKQTCITDIFHNIGWKLLKSSCQILDGVFDAFKQLLSFNFAKIPAIQQFIQSTSPIAWAVFGLAIVLGAIILMVNKDKLKISEYFKNIIVCAMLIVALPFTFQCLEEMKNSDVEDMISQLEKNDTIGKTILASITIDVGNSAKSGKVSTLAENNVNAYYIQPNDTLSKNDGWEYEVKTQPFNYQEVIFSGDVSTYAANYMGISNDMYNSYFKLSTTSDKEQYFNKYLKTKIANHLNDSSINEMISLEEVYQKYEKNIVASMNYFNQEMYKTCVKGDVVYYFHKINDGIVDLGIAKPHFSFLEEGIYAYNYNFIMGLLLVIITIIAIFFAGLKIVSILYDIVFNQIIAPIVIASDLQGSGRTKKILQNIISSYLIFIIVLVLVKIYLDINIWAIGELTEPKQIFIKLMILVGTAKGLIDGPDIIVKLLGLDAGVKSGYAAIYGIQTAGRTVGSTLHTGRKIALAPFKMAGNINRGIGGNTTKVSPPPTVSSSLGSKTVPPPTTKSQ